MAEESSNSSQDTFSEVTDAFHLVCPHCKGRLEFHDESFYCVSCKTVVGKRSGHFDDFMLDVDLDPELQEFYEEEGTKGDESGGPRINAQKFKIPNVLRVLPQGLSPKRYLDMGCGGGWILESMLKKFPISEAAGLDISSTRLVEASSRNPTVHHVRAPVESVPFPDDSFDLLTSLDVIEHIPEPEQLLQEAHRLAPHLVIKLPLEDTLFDRFQKEFWWPFKRTLKEWLSGTTIVSSFEAHLHRFNLQSARALLRNQGFEIKNEHVIHHPWRDDEAFMYPPAFGITNETKMQRFLDFHTKRFILLWMRRLAFILLRPIYYRLFNSGVYFYCQRKEEKQVTLH